MPNSSRVGDFWPVEREGFSEPLRPAYAAVRLAPSPRPSATLKYEERIGSIIAGAGLCWAANVLVHQTGAVSNLGLWPAGPLEVCAIGILIWLHAKWRRSVRPR